MGNNPPQVRRDFSVVPRDGSRGVLDPSAPAYQQSLSGFRFPHPGAGIDPRDLRLPPRLIRVVAIWTVFVTWGWELVLLVYGGTSGSAKGPSFAACWHLEPISHKPGELGFLHPAGTYPPGETAF